MKIKGIITTVLCSLVFSTSLLTNIATNPEQIVFAAEKQEKQGAEIEKSEPLVYASSNTSVTSSSELKKKYYYSTLNNRLKKAYVRCLEAEEKHTERVELTDLKLSDEEWQQVHMAVKLDNPMFDFYVTHGGRYTDGDIYLYYDKSQKEADKMKAAIKKIAKPVIANAKKKKTDLEKVRYITDWMVSHSRFCVQDTVNEDKMVYTIYSLIVKGRGVCNAYMQTFTYFMQELNIPVCAVHVNAGEHAANKVKIAGKWYNLDVSWTDTGYTSEIRDILKFQYYLVGDETFYKTHKPGLYGGVPFNLKLPKANTDALNKKIAAEEKKLWHPSWVEASLTKKDYEGEPDYELTDFTIDTKTVYKNAPFSFKVKTEGYCNGFIERMYSVKPNTKYRLSAMLKFSGSGLAPDGKKKATKNYGAYIEIGGYAAKESCIVKDNKWTKVQSEMTTGSDQKEISLTLGFGGAYDYNLKARTRVKGTAWFCDVKLEKYENGKWVTVDNSNSIGHGFYNLEDVQKKISKLKFSELDDVVYNGKARKVSITIKDGSYTLMKDKDYSVSYKNNKSVGVATVTIEGKGLYKGTKIIKFKILPKQPKLTVTKGSSKVKLAIEQVKGAELYYVYMSKDGQDFELVDKLNPDNLSVSVAYKKGHTYQFAVGAIKYVADDYCFSDYVYSDVIK